MELDLKNTNNSLLGKWLGDIRFWILLFFILRLYGITNAPLEISHNWRQSLTNMIARNFLEVNNSILYPRIDMDGNKTGIIASEFPLYSYLIYLFAKIFGYAHWYGRLISLIFSSIGVFYFHNILKKFFTKDVALYSSIILMSSIWFAFSRKSMPDTFCMSLAIIGVYYGLMYLYETRIRYLFLFFIISSLAVLSKIPALYLLSVLAIPLFDKNVICALKRNILIVGTLLLLVVGAWYFYWVPYLLATYGFQLYFPKQLGEGLRELILYWPDALEKFYFSALQSFIAFAAFLMGIYLIVKQKLKVLLAIVLVASTFFILFIIKTGFVFAVHNYYVIPYVPIMALVAGFAIVKIKNARWRILITTLIVVEALLNQQHDFRLKDHEKYKLSLEQVADNISDRTDLFAINSGQNPQQIYFLHRKGWTINNEQAMDTVFLNNLVEKGCKFLFINKHYLNSAVMNSDKNKLIVFENEHFVVYSLSN